MKFLLTILFPFLCNSCMVHTSHTNNESIKSPLSKYKLINVRGDTGYVLKHAKNNTFLSIALNEDGNITMSSLNNHKDRKSIVVEWLGNANWKTHVIDMKNKVFVEDTNMDGLPDKIISKNK